MKKEPVVKKPRKKRVAAGKKVPEAPSTCARVLTSVRHPELKLNVPAQVFCMSWRADFEFRVT